MSLGGSTDKAYVQVHTMSKRYSLHAIAEFRSLCMPGRLVQPLDLSVSE